MSFSTKKLKWIVSCEHAGNKIPHEYLFLFLDKADILQSHRGIDIGVKDAFNEFKKIADFWMINHQSRLLIEFNRSLHHRSLFSEFSNILPEKDKHHLIQHYYNPYRKRLEKTISDFIENGFAVIHLSIHSFTPMLEGKIRNADIGLLYDSRHSEERAFCRLWKDHIKTDLPIYTTRLNYPYLGKADGLTTYLRKIFPSSYLGVEIELNQKNKKKFSEISAKMIASLPY